MAVTQVLGCDGGCSAAGRGFQRSILQICTITIPCWSL